MPLVEQLSLAHEPIGVAEIRTTLAQRLHLGPLEHDSHFEMVEDLDTQIGRILKTLDETGLAKRTLVVFASDNGAMKPDQTFS